MAPPSVHRIDKFDVLRRLGRGGMGSVYLARDPDIDRLVAIKLLHEGFDNEELRGRFNAEARSASALRHTNIVTIFQTGTFLERPFIVMEYIEGETFADVIASRRPMPLADKLQLFDQLLAGLQYAHAKGVVHRDIKPSNVMTDNEGVVRILDFGIARLGDGGLTRTGVVLGTINYMSPEQLAGQVVDARADIFSAGLVGYELLTSKQAFGQSFPEILRHIGFQDPQPIEELCPGIDPDLVRVINRCLAKRADERYADCSAVRRDLDVVRQSLARNVGGAVPATIAFPSAVDAPATSPTLVIPRRTPFRGSERESSHSLPRKPQNGLAAQSAAKDTGNQPRALPGYSGRKPLAGSPSSSGAPEAIQAAESRPTRRLKIAGVAMAVLIAAGVTWRLNGPVNQSKDATVSSPAPQLPAAAAPAAPVTVAPPVRAPSPDTRPASGFPGDASPGDLLRAQASDAWKRGDVEIALASVAAAAPLGPVEANARLLAEFVAASRDRATVARRSALSENGRGTTTHAAGDARFTEGDRLAKQGQAADAVRAYVDAARRFQEAAKTTPPPDPVRVGGAVKAPKLISRISPEYPAAALSSRVQGVVLLEATIGIDGKINDVRVTRSIPLLDSAAVDAVRQWVYEPTVVNGGRVPVIISVAVEFKLTAPQPIRVGGEIKPPTQTKRVTPPYPPEAQAAGVQGIVIMEATIGADGKVIDVRVLRSIPLLDQAAMDAVRQFEYTPTVINGVAVPVLMTVTVNFTLTSPAVERQSGPPATAK